VIRDVGQERIGQGLSLPEIPNVFFSLQIGRLG
jgi:hypothetical protein